MTHQTEEYEQLLTAKGVRPTANRLMIARYLSGATSPLSMSDLETSLETLDKSTIFRTLTLFERKHVVHAIEDGSGSVKYELCGGRHACSIGDMHAHFHCLDCGETFCLDDSPVTPPVIPEGFRAQSLNFVIKGLCRKCARKNGAVGD